MRTLLEIAPAEVDQTNQSFQFVEGPARWPKGSFSQYSTLDPTQLFGIFAK